MISFFGTTNTLCGRLVRHQSLLSSHLHRIHHSRGFSSSSSPLKLFPKLLLPRARLTETLWDIAQGVWLHFTDQASRDAYETFIKDGIIQDTVIQRSRDGSMLTYSLFHQLQNPVWKDCQIDLKEFVTVVGPALENYFNVYGTLRNDLPSLLQQETAGEQQQKEEQTDEAPKNKENDKDDGKMSENITELVFGKNLWRQRAEQDPESLEAALINMTTDTYFDYLYYSDKLSFSGPNSLPEPTTLSIFGDYHRTSMKQSRARFRYVPDSFKVNEVALLQARTMHLHPSNEEDDSQNKHPEFQASDVREESIPIAAQMDVLYEATYTFELDETNVGATGGKQKQITKLGVAIFEGWIRGSDPHRKKGNHPQWSSPSQRGLQWKVAMLRKADEFPLSKPTVT